MDDTVDDADREMGVVVPPLIDEPEEARDVDR